MKKQHFGFLAAMFVFCLAIIPTACAQDIETQAGTKYLAISALKDVYFSLSADERMELTKASNADLAASAKAGEILEFYGVPGQNLRVAILQCESVESLSELFERSPMYPYVEHQVYPLVAVEAEGIEIAMPDPEKMKFLVINEAKDIYVTLPADERTKIDSRENPFQTDNLLALYGIPGWNRTVAIEQYGSIEALYKHFEEDAYFPYGEFEVYSLYPIDLLE